MTKKVVSFFEEIEDDTIAPGDTDPSYATGDCHHLPLSYLTLPIIERCSFTYTSFPHSRAISILLFMTTVYAALIRPTSATTYNSKYRQRQNIRPTSLYRRRN